MFALVRIRVRECDGVILFIEASENWAPSNQLLAQIPMGQRVRLQISSCLAKTWISLNAVKGKPWVPTMLEGRVFGILTPIPRWWFQLYFFKSFPIAGEVIQFDINFSEGGSNTNQMNVSSEIGGFRKCGSRSYQPVLSKKNVLNLKLHLSWWYPTCLQ